MTTPVKIEDYPFLPVDEGNQLVCTESKSNQRKGRDDDDIYFDEVSPNGDVVAKYHVHYYMSIYPPQKSDNGWKKYDLNSKQIASGKI